MRKKILVFFVLIFLVLSVYVYSECTTENPSTCSKDELNKLSPENLGKAVQNDQTILQNNPDLASKLSDQDLSKAIEKNPSLLEKPEIFSAACDKSPDTVAKLVGSNPDLLSDPKKLEEFHKMVQKNPDVLNKAGNEQVRNVYLQKQYNAGFVDVSKGSIEFTNESIYSGGERIELSQLDKIASLKSLENGGFEIVLKNGERISVITQSGQIIDMVPAGQTNEVSATITNDSITVFSGAVHFQDKNKDYSISGEGSTIKINSNNIDIVLSENGRFLESGPSGKLAQVLIDNKNSKPLPITVNTEDNPSKKDPKSFVQSVDGVYLEQATYKMFFNGDYVFEFKESGQSNDKWLEGSYINGEVYVKPNQKQMNNYRIYSEAGILYSREGYEMLATTTDCSSSAEITGAVIADITGMASCDAGYVDYVLCDSGVPVKINGREATLVFSPEKPISFEPAKIVNGKVYITQIGDYKANELNQEDKLADPKSGGVPAGKVFVNYKEGWVFKKEFGMLVPQNMVKYK